MRVISAVALGTVLLAYNAAAKPEKGGAAKPSATKAGGVFSYASLAQTGTLLKDIAVYAGISAYDALPPGAQEAVTKAQAEVSSAYDKHGKKHVDTVTTVVSGAVGTGMEMLTTK